MTLTIERTVRLFTMLLLALGLAHCAAVDPEGGEFEDIDLEELRYRTRQDDRWVYNGMLPALESPRVVASLKAHTVRVTGLLPAGWSRPLPFYAVTEPVGTRTRVTVVYPIATGANTNGPGDYPDLRAIAWLPYARNSAGQAVEWGGFPFLEYHHRRGLAFHGPITHSGTEWRLKRGPVSHGCNRMQGEHVVEMAHLLGLDMDAFHRAYASQTLRVSVSVIEDFDTFNGKYVDVDYPADPRVARPRTNVQMFRTWDSRDFPRFVCARAAARPLGPEHCDYLPEGQLDPTTGRASAASALVDNAETARVTVAGGWQTSTGRPGFVGRNYLALPAGGAGEVSFRVPVAQAGRYRVWASYIPHASRNTRVVYRVYTSADAAPREIEFNQRAGSGWADLGTFSLAAGARVTVDGTGGDGYTIADAVRVAPAR